MMHHHSTSTRAFAALIFFCIDYNLQLIYAQSDRNCVALPCTYKNECRDKFNTCGGGQLYCNSESLWLPACGGGGSFERPSEENNNADSNAQNESTITPPPTPRPTLRSTSTPTKRPTNSPTLSPQQPSTESSPTPPRADAPTTTNSAAAFEGWLSEQNSPKNEIDEETENYNPSNSAWFDASGWDGRREKGENNDTNEALAMRRTSCGIMLGIATIFHLLMMLS